MECEVKKKVNPHNDVKVVSPVVCWLFLAQYKHRTNEMYSYAHAMF